MSNLIVFIDLSDVFLMCYDIYLSVLDLPSSPNKRPLVKL